MYCTLLCLFQVNTVVAVLTVIAILGIIGLSFYKSPFVSVVAILLFLFGLPLYGFIVLLRRRETPKKLMGKLPKSFPSSFASFKRLLFQAESPSFCSKHCCWCQKVKLQKNRVSFQNSKNDSVSIVVVQVGL